MIDPTHKEYVSSEVERDVEPFAPDSSHGIMVRMAGYGHDVLEVGCATGYMSRRLAAFGNRVTGLDFNAEALEEAKAYCTEVIVADLDTSSIADAVGDRRFDVIIFGDVLEHLRDPWRVFDEARRLFKPQGFAVVSIPNIAHGSVRLALLRGTFEYSQYGILDNTHMRFFTLRSIRELCSRAGYQIDEIDRTKVPLFHDTEVIPNVPAVAFDEDVIEAIKRDPEHDTLQFVFRATPIAEADQLRIARDDLSDSSQRLSEASATIRAFEARAERQGTATARVTELELLLAERNAECDSAYARVEQLSLEAENLRADVRKVQDLYRTMQQSYRTVSDTLAEHLTAEAARLRAESTAVDEKIQAIQRSPVWRAKRLLGGMRQFRSRGKIRA